MNDDSVDAMVTTSRSHEPPSFLGQQYILGGDERHQVAHRDQKGGEYLGFIVVQALAERQGDQRRQQ